MAVGHHSPARATPDYCTDSNDPDPTPIEVTQAPIAVTSTTADYFVLYVSHDAEGDEWEIPVLVKQGEAGTTSLAENIEALAADHYRVEKYLVNDPADVDGDCIDDITELNNLGPMNPISPSGKIAPIDGTVMLPTEDDFPGDYARFVITNPLDDDPALYFINSATHPLHGMFTRAVGISGVARGRVAYHPEVAGPDGELGVYSYWTLDSTVFKYAERIHTMMAANLPLLDDNLALYLPNADIRIMQEELPKYRESRIDLVFDDDVYPDNFLALNEGEGYGRLRMMEADERPHPRDVVIYESLPSELPKVAGIISTALQTPLSHVNLRAVQDQIPNAFIRTALDDPNVTALEGSYVHYRVTSAGWSLSAATKAQVDAHYASSRPTAAQTPARDLSVTTITPLGAVGFNDWTAFGVKAANLAVLGRLGFPGGTVPDGFAIPFYFYDEFMKHNNLYAAVARMLADEKFQADYDEQNKQLKALRDAIKDATTPAWIKTALTEMHATYPEGQSLRYRSSTNNEDLPHFNGAGLYDSKTQKPSETEEDGIDKSFKQVLAGLWTFRAFTERDFHRIDHMATAMGALVHPNYSDELANGVAVSLDLNTGIDGYYYVNTQLGEDLVTLPQPNSVPEELLVGPNGQSYLLAISNLVEPGALLMSDAQINQLYRHLTTIHDRFNTLYGPLASDPFAMEIEFKITSGNILAIKQARPWVFSGTPSRTPASPPTISATGDPPPYQEDGTGAVFTFQAQDPGNRSTSWAVTGTDGDAFDISSSGALTFATPPDFENPTDSDRDNRYEIAVVVINNLGLTDRVNVTVTVTNDATDDPNVTLQFGQGAYTVIEGDTQPITVTLSVGLQRTVVVPIISAAEGGASDDDYSGVPQSVTFTPGQTSATFDFIVTDDPHDSGEAVLLSFGTPPVGLRAGTPNELRVSIANSGPGVSEASVDGAALTLTFDEALDNGEVPDKSAFTVTVGGNNRGIDAVAVSGSAVTLTLAAAVLSTDVVTVGYAVPTDESAARLQDLVGNATDSFSGQSVVNNTPASASLTASAHNMPASHDGSGSFTFELRFSEDFPIGYARLRDHAFTVTDGQVVNARRLEPPANIRWEISVRPDGNGNVAVLLPVTTDCATQSAICTGSDLKLSAALTVTVPGPPPNTPATGAPIISGAAQVGETLTASTTGIADVDGLTNVDGLTSVSYAYQWVRNDDSDIGGATASSYTLVAADQGKTIKVRVDFTDDAGNAETLTSAATAAVVARPNSPATGAPAISGAAQVGETLTASTTGIADVDGLTSVSYAYQWVRNDDSDIGRATASSYTLVAADQGKTIKVRVSFTDDAGNAETLTSAATAAVVARPNDPATGAPIISGAAQVGETLTASTTGIADADGLTSVSYAYQWVRNDDSDIGGATASSYTLVAADQGKTIKVRVSFTDDAGNAETLTSAATAAVVARPNSPATGAPIISGAAQVGETLTASTTGIADTDGLTSGSYAYQWVRNDDSDIGGATASSYTLVAADQGKTIKVRVSFTDDAGNAETLTSAATAAVVARPNSPATGAPAISGAAQVGETLTASTTGIADADGLTSVSYTYQWLAGDAAIQNATDSTYTLAGSDQGKTIKVRVSFTDDAGNAETLTSAATAAVAARPNTPASGAPAISGAAQVGETLTASTTGIADADGLTSVSYAYQWLAGDTAIQNATDSTYTMAGSDQGKTIKVRVSFTDDAGNAETLTSAATTAVVARPNSPATGLASMRGRARVGVTLTALTIDVDDADGMTGSTFSYQWLADDVDISGATGRSYTLTSSEQGKAIRVRVSFTDDAGHLESFTSPATGSVAEAWVLTASEDYMPASHDGSSTFVFQLEFSEEPRSDFSYRVLRDHAFSVTGGEVIKAQRKLRPGNLRWAIYVRPDGAGTVTIVLSPTTDCDAQGAICTDDGRMLSNRLEFTVPND